MILGIAEIEDIENFRLRVRSEGCTIFQMLLTDRWFEEIKKSVEEVLAHRNNQYSHHYFPIRWLIEDGQWEFINEGLKSIDKITKKKRYLRNLVYGVSSVDWMTSSANALGLSVLCRFARDGILIDIEPKISENSGNRADALVNISGRDILVEATQVTKSLVSERATFGSVDVGKMMFQTISKLMDKAEQLGGAKQPTVVISTYSPGIGADPHNAEWAVIENIESFPKISAVLVSSDHKFQYGAGYINESADFGLNKKETEYFLNLLILPPPLQRDRARRR